MNHRIKYFALVLMAFVVIVPAYASPIGTARDTVKRSFTVQPGGTLFIDVDFGNVTVESSNDSMVRVEIERLLDERSEDEAKRILSRHEWRIDQESNDVVIESRFERDRDGFMFRGNRSGLRVHVRVIVPREYNVEFKSGAGNVVIADLNGTVVGTTGAGNIEVGEVDGSVEIRSGSGNIDIAGVDGAVEVNSGAGNVSLGYVTGQVRANTGAGNVTARITEQPRGGSILESGAGSVTVFLAENVGVDVDAHASVGSASCDFGLRVSGKWMSKTFEGEVNGGGPALTMRSGVGNVALRRM